MTDSSMYSSLFALVESHLSKTSLQDNGENPSTSTLNIPPLNGLRDGTVSETLLNMQTRPRLPIPSLSPNGSPIQSILAQQVANMLLAKEKQQQEEKQKLEEKLRHLKLEEEKNTPIDLTKAIQFPYNPKPNAYQKDTVSRSSSVESLFKVDFTDCDGETQKTKTPEPVLPCITDMSYILKEKVKMAKCSTFGKVLSKRLRPVPALYFRETIYTDIKKFDFSTPSPCDIAKANRKFKPSMSTAFTFDITKFV